MVRHLIFFCVVATLSFLLRSTICPVTYFSVDLQTNYHHSCGIPIYSPELTAPCLTCGTVQNLSINPAIIGSLLDETGALEAEKLQWTPKAWRELLGEAGAIGILRGDKGDGEARGINEIKELQERITGLRFSFLVGWAGEMGRLCVLGLRM